MDLVRTRAKVVAVYEFDYELEIYEDALEDLTEDQIKEFLIEDVLDLVDAVDGVPIVNIEFYEVPVDGGIDGDDEQALGGRTDGGSEEDRQQRVQGGAGQDA
jgi:hypothetical protein